MNTTISISKETRTLLQEFGKKSENYDAILKRMYNQIKIQEKIAEYINENEHVTLEEAKEWTKLKIKSMSK